MSDTKTAEEIQAEAISAMEALQTEAKSLKEKLDAKSLTEDEQKSLKDESEKLNQRLEVLEAEKKAADSEVEKKALFERLDSIESRLEDGRKPHDGFQFGNKPAGDSKSMYGTEESDRSFYNDIRLQYASNSEAQKALTQTYEAKAMGEGTASEGGFMVIPEVANELITIRDHASVLRTLFSSHNISVDTIRFISQDNGLAVAWQAEFSEKITSQFKFSEFEAHVFTAAGLAVASNQLLADSKWQIDRMINTDLAKRFVSLEEQAFLNGDGEGEPLGILNTPGVESIAHESTDTIQDLIDSIQDAITSVYTNFLGAPNAIVMHPRVWAKIVKAREATSPSTYLIGAGATAFGRRGDEPIPGYGAAPLPRGELHGLPVYCTPNVPTNLGGGTESAVFIGDFSQGLVLDRQGVTTDKSEHVYFTTNQTVFRSEERVGFTAGRYPKAFAVVQGAGLAANKNG